MTERWLKLFFYGLCIGTADIVPGVSGGTIAFIIGIYEELISSLKKFWRHMDFLVPVVSGMAIALASLAGLLQFLLGHEVYRVWVYCVFFGLIIASVWFCSKQIRKWQVSYFLLLLGGVAAAFFLTTVRAEPVGGYDVVVSGIEFTNVAEETLSAMQAKGIIDGQTPVHRDGFTYMLSDIAIPAHGWKVDGWMVVCGAVAISAMLLPGISGSYMLTVMGVYPIVIGALADFVRGDLDAFWILASVGIGIVIGAVLFSRVISWLLSHYHNATLAMLIGFMIGALPVVWPFWSFTYVVDPLNVAKGVQLQPVAPVLPALDSPVLLVGAVLALVGFLLVVVMEKTARQKVAYLNRG